MLADKFGMRPWEIDRLTDREIREVYFHPRDAQGNVKFPIETVETPQTYEGEMAEIESLANSGCPTEIIEKAKEKLTAKYAGRRTDDTSQSPGAIDPESDSGSHDTD